MVRAAQVVRAGKRYAVTRLLKIPRDELPGDDQQAFARELRARMGAAGIPVARVVVGLPPQASIVRYSTAPPAPPWRLSLLVQYEVDELAERMGEKLCAGWRKHVIGVGTKGSTSALLRDNCDEFIYYEDLVPSGRSKPQAQVQVVVPAPVVVVPETVPVTATVPAVVEKQPEAMGLLVEALQTLQSEKRERFWSSLIKTAIRRRHPSFEESAYGYRGFDRMLEDAAAKGLVTLERDSANRTYIVKDFKAGDTPQPVEEAKPAARKPARRRPRRRTRKPATAKA
mgnify:CR=1 FL=1